MEVTTCHMGSLCKDLLIHRVMDISVKVKLELWLVTGLSRGFVFIITSIYRGLVALEVSGKYLKLLLHFILIELMCLIHI